MNPSTYKESTLQPSASERIPDIDILRGFALFGIMIVNVFYFCVPNAYYYAHFNSYKDLWNEIAFHGMNFFFSGKFYPIFSFLFGFGFYLQFSRLTAKGFNPKAIFARRMAILLLFGLLHILLVWEEDILLFYALFGFALIPLANQPPRRILALAVTVYLIFLGSNILIANDLMTYKQNAFPSLAEYVHFYRTASYGEIMALRLNIYWDKLFTLAGFTHHLDRFAYFLLGLYAARKNFLADLLNNPRKWYQLWLPAFVFGILVHGLWAWFDQNFHSIISQTLFSLVGDLLLLVQVFAYITGFLLILNLRENKKAFNFLIRPGQMALTNYLGHTTLFSLVFYSYGLKLYNRLAPIQLVLITVLVFVLQIVISNLWLKYFRYGPLEWLWRCATYGKMLPLRKPAIEISRSAVVAFTE